MKIAGVEKPCLAPRITGRAFEFEVAGWKIPLFPLRIFGSDGC